MSWWPVVAMMATVLAALLCYRNIAISSMLILGFEALSMAALLVLGIAIVLRTPFSTTPFTPAPGLGWAGIGYGVVFAITSYSGFEGAATLGEEADRPFETIPAAMIGTLIVGGVFFTFMSYVQVVGFGGSAVKLAQAGAPLASLGASYIAPWYGQILDAAAAIGCFAGLSGCVAAASRLLLTISRCGVLPRFQAIDTVHGVPRRAIAAIGALTTLGILMTMRGMSAVAAAGTYFVIGTLAIILIYMSVTIAELVLSTRARRPIRAAISLAGLLLLAWPLASTIYPIPPWPADVLPYVVAVWLLVGFVVALRRTVSVMQL